MSPTICIHFSGLHTTFSTHFSVMVVVVCAVSIFGRSNDGAGSESQEKSKRSDANSPIQFAGSTPMSKCFLGFPWRILLNRWTQSLDFCLHDELMMLEFTHGTFGLSSVTPIARRCKFQSKISKEQLKVGLIDSFKEKNLILFTDVYYMKSNTLKPLSDVFALHRRALASWHIRNCTFQFWLPLTSQLTGIFRLCYSSGSVRVSARLVLCVKHTHFSNWFWKISSQNETSNYGKCRLQENLSYISFSPK